MFYLKVYCKNMFFIYKDVSFCFSYFYMGRCYYGLFDKQLLVCVFEIVFLDQRIEIVGEINQVVYKYCIYLNKSGKNNL